MFDIISPHSIFLSDLTGGDNGVSAVSNVCLWSQTRLGQASK